MPYQITLPNKGISQEEILEIPQNMGSSYELYYKNHVNDMKFNKTFLKIKWTCFRCIL